MTTRVYGSKDDSGLSIVEINKRIRKELREESKKNHLLKGATFRVVKNHYNAISIHIDNLPFNPVNPVWVQEYGKHSYGSGESYYTQDGQQAIDTVKEIANAYNYDGCDYYSDYFDVNFYLDVSPDGEFCRKCREEIEADLEKHLERYRASELEKMPVCEQCGQKTDQLYLEKLCWNCYHPIWKREKEIEDEQYRIAQLNHERAIAPLMELQPTELENPVMIKAVEPSLNKQCTLDEYKEQLKSPENYTVVKGKITHGLRLSEDEYNLLCDNLLENFPWMVAGGTDCDIDFDGVESVLQLNKEQLQIYRENCYNYYLLVACEGKTPFLIDCQGYKYARYIAFPVSLQDEIEGAEKKKKRAKIVQLSEYRRNVA